jgi:hypothetical protein
MILTQAELLIVSNWLCNVTRVVYRFSCQVELNMNRSCQHFAVQWDVNTTKLTPHSFPIKEGIQSRGCQFTVGRFRVLNDIKSKMNPGQHPDI